MPSEIPNFGDTSGQSPDVDSRSAQDKIGHSGPAVFGSFHYETTNPIRAAGRRRVPYIGPRGVIGKTKRK